MGNDIVKRLRYQTPDPRRGYKSDATVLVNPDGEKAADYIEKLESRLKKAIEIADDYAFTAGKWIDSEIDYEEFYSWREDLN